MNETQARHWNLLVLSMRLGRPQNEINTWLLRFREDFEPTPSVGWQFNHTEDLVFSDWEKYFYSQLKGKRLK